MVSLRKIRGRSESALPHAVVSVAALALLLAVSGRAWAQDRTARDTAAVTPAPVAPRIRFSATTFDFGLVAQGTVVQHDYVFTNPGGAPLLITGVYPSCDCTTAGKWSVRVEPGRAGTIPVRFDSSDYGGPIDKWLVVTSNDPAQPRVTLLLKGAVRPAIEVLPSNAVFTPVAGPPASETKVLRIVNHTAEPLTLAAPESSNRAFAVDLKTVRPGKEFEVRVTTVPPFGPGTVVGQIALKTNSPRRPIIAITALVVVRKPVATAAATGSGKLNR